MLRQKGMEIPFVSFEDEIQKFKEFDSNNQVVKNGILFVGDSDIRYWTFDNQFYLDFKELPVLNRGFGGARTWETLLYFNELILPSQPEIIVYCCGDNDIAKLAKDGVNSAVVGFQLFVEMVKSRAPFVNKILYLEIHPSPADEPLWGFISQANLRLEKICEDETMLQFIKFKFLLENKVGKLDPKNFIEDQYHFSPKFYQRFADFLRPKLMHELKKETM